MIVARRHLGGYSLYAGSDFNIEDAIREASAETLGCDYGRLRGTGVFAPILAKRHYHLTGAMRWFDVDVASLDNAEDRIDRFRGDAGAVGLFLLVVNESGVSKATVRRRIESLRTRVGDRAVALGVAADSYLLRETSMELLALERVLASRPELKGDVVARREIASRIARLSAELEEQLRSSLAVTYWHLPKVYDTGVDLENVEGAVRLSLLASALANAIYPLAPHLANELVNRAKPSANAMAALKALMIAMVRFGDRPLLGIDGFPPERGLYASILQKPGIHREVDGKLGFFEPSNGEHRLASLWVKADELIDGGGPGGTLLSSLFALWRARPYGVKDGLLPILGLAYILSRQDQVSIYLDGNFCASLGDLLVDRLVQDAASVRIRRVELSDRHSRILQDIAILTATLLGESAPVSAEPLAVGRQLVALVTRAPAWVRRTQRLGPTAVRVRDLAAAAHDPNKFMLDDLPRIFQHEEDIEVVVAQIRDGLIEIVNAYSGMLDTLRDGLFLELAAHRDTDLSRLRDRAARVVGLTGNYRLDAFATRLRDYDGSIEGIEGLLSLAANKPPRDWVDRDVDAARIELAALAQEFLRAEGLAHVKGRPNGRTRMALFVSDPGRPALAIPDFTVDEIDRQRASALARKLKDAIDSRLPSEVVLAALIELGSVYNDKMEKALLAKPSTAKERA